MMCGSKKYEIFNLRTNLENDYLENIETSMSNLTSFEFTEYKKTAQNKVRLFGITTIKGKEHKFSFTLVINEDNSSFIVRAFG